MLCKRMSGCRALYLGEMLLRGALARLRQARVKWRGIRGVGDVGGVMLPSPGTPAPPTLVSKLRPKTA